MLKRIIAFILCFSLIPMPCHAIYLSGAASIVICSDTNQILFGKDIHKKMGMASTTKIMTAIIALEHGNKEDIVIVSQNAEKQEGSSVYLKKGDKVMLSDLLYALMLNSGNDAAVAIAEHISKSEEAFVELMNKKAKELNLKNTHFENPCGLPAKDHFSTAYDMAILMSYALKNPEFAKITGTKNHEFKTGNTLTKLKNHNKLLWKYPFSTGGKTGFTKSSGRCLVSSAKKDGISLVAVTLNAPDDWNDHLSLLDYGFSKVRLTEVFEKNQIIATRKIGDSRVNILTQKSYFLPLENGKKHPVICKIHLDYTAKGDIKCGSYLGYGEIFVGNFFVGRINLISGQEIEGSFPLTLINSVKSILSQFLF